MPNTDEDRVALFIDVDNIVISAQAAGVPFNLSYVIDRARQEGLLMSARAYADWASPSLRPVLPEFRLMAVELVELPTTMTHNFQERKNTADIQLAVDALEMVLSAVRPATVMIVGGDRDYVPLVQKLKRYGTRVLGVGVQGSVSAILSQACDLFVYYEDLVPSTGEVDEPVPPADVAPVHALMRRAVEVLISEGRQSSGASVIQMMRQLDPTFDLARYRTTFKELAASAQEAGAIRVYEQPGSDVQLTLGDVAPQAEPPKPPVPVRKYDYSTPSSAAASYRLVLQDARIPLLPWKERRGLLAALWEELRTAGDAGMTMDEMRDYLESESHNLGYRVPFQAIQKLLYTLNFGQCFIPEGERRRRRLLVPAEVRLPVRPAFEKMQEAESALHQSYLDALEKSGAILDSAGLYELLYDSQDQEEAEQARRLEEIEQWCDQRRPQTAVSQALRLAQRRSADGRDR